MKIVYGIENIDEDFKNCIVTIGAFDGVHIGHQKIIHEAKKYANSLSVSELVITFDLHPIKIVDSKETSLILTTLEHKLKLLSDYGVKKCLVLQANRKFFNMSPEKFVKDILYNKLHIQQIVIGDDFSFGKDSKGNIDLLRKLGRKYNFTVISVNLVKLNSDIISSTLIRKSVKKSKLVKVRRMLGRNFSVLGKLKKRKTLSEELNLLFFDLEYTQEIVPKEGIYVIKIKYNNKKLRGLAIVGMSIPDSQSIDKKGTDKIMLILYSEETLDDVHDALVEIEFIRLIHENVKFGNMREFKKFVYKNKNIANSKKVCY